MEKREFTQFGTFSVSVMLPIFTFVLAMLFIAGINDLQKIVNLYSRIKSMRPANP